MDKSKLYDIPIGIDFELKHFIDCNDCWIEPKYCSRYMMQGCRCQSKQFYILKSKVEEKRNCQNGCDLPNCTLEKCVVEVEEKSLEINDRCYELGCDHAHRNPKGNCCMVKVEERQYKRPANFENVKVFEVEEKAKEETFNNYIVLLKKHLEESTIEERDKIWREVKDVCAVEDTKGDRETRRSYNPK